MTRILGFSSAAWFFLSLILLLTETAECQVTTQEKIPEPWNSIGSLTQKQRNEIQTIIEGADKDVANAIESVTQSRTEILQGAGAKELIKMDIATTLKRTVHVIRVLERRKIEALLTSEQLRRADVLRSAVVQTEEMYDLDEFAAAQKTPDWCWAAVVQTLLNYNGIHWDQPRIVQDIKGSVVSEAASAEDISKGLSGWRVDHRQPSETWNASCDHTKGVPAQDIVVGSLKRNVFMFIGLDGDHHTFLERH